MDIPKEIKDMIKEEAIKINKTVNINSLILLFFATVSCIYAIFSKPMDTNTEMSVLFLFIASAIFFIGSIRTYFSGKIPLGEASLNKWYWSLPSSSLVVKNVDSLVKEKEEKEQDKKSIHLKEYKIRTKNGKRLLLFVTDGKEMSIPLDEVEYDEGEKRIEFHVSDRDWTVNIQKGTWFNVKIYNV